MADKRPDNFHKGKQLFFPIACVNRVQDIAGIHKVLQLVGRAALEPRPDFFKIGGGVKLPHDGCAEFVGHSPLF